MNPTNLFSFRHGEGSPSLDGSPSVPELSGLLGISGIGSGRCPPGGVSTRRGAGNAGVPAGDAVSSGWPEEPAGKLMDFGGQPFIAPLSER